MLRRGFRPSRLGAAVMVRRRFRLSHLGTAMMAMISLASRVWTLLFDDLSSVIFRQPTIIITSNDSRAVTCLIQELGREFSLKDKAPKSRVPSSGRRANHGHHCSTKARGSKLAFQPALQHQGARVETRVSASTAAPRREGRHPRLSCNRPGYRVNHGLHNGKS